MPQKRRARISALRRTDQGSGRFWRGRVRDAFHFRIAAGKQHSKRNRLDFGNAGRGLCLQRLGHADRHQRAIGAIHRQRFLRAARHVFGHGRCFGRCFVGHGGHSHRCRWIRVRPRRERGKYEASDQKDRQQPAKVDRAFHGDGFRMIRPIMGSQVPSRKRGFR